MIDISKGRYWDLPLSWVDGCNPCSPGCDHCWSAAMTRRFHIRHLSFSKQSLVDGDGKFTGEIITHPDRLSIPSKRRKPTVYAIWNDWCHEAVPFVFHKAMVRVALAEPQHAFLALTKRPQGAANFFGLFEINPPDNWWTGLTLCNQAEADEKIPVFLQVPGKKFLSLEPLISPISFRWMKWISRTKPTGHLDILKDISGAILGGETGPGARPLHPDWVRSVRDQCAESGVPFFFKGWGKHVPAGQASISQINTRRFLDGRTHNDLPWYRQAGA